MPAVVVLSYFTAVEKKNLRTEWKQKYVIKNEKTKKLWLLLHEQQKNDRSSLFFSSKLAGLLISEKVLSAQVCSLACVYSITVLWLKTRTTLALQRYVNLGIGACKKVTATTNNRIQVGFNSARRKKAKFWTQNQLTNWMHNYQKDARLFGNVPQNILFHLRLAEWSVFNLTLVVLNPN